MARKETGITVLDARHAGFNQVSSGWSTTYPVTVSNSMVYIPLPTTNTIYTDALPIDDCYSRNMGFGCILNGVAASTNAIVTAEGGWGKPSVEGSFSPIYFALTTCNMTAGTTSWNYIALLSASITTITPYVRFKVVSSGVATSGTVNIKLIKQVSG